MKEKTLNTHNNPLTANRLFKCSKDCHCPSCPHISVGRSVGINLKDWKINRRFDCNVGYAIMCKKKKCQLVYIGETKRMIKFRLANNCGYVCNQATGEQPGHNLADLTVTVLEQSKRNDLQYQKQREKYHINRFNTFNKGIQ